MELWNWLVEDKMRNCLYDCGCYGPYLYCCVFLLLTEVACKAIRLGGHVTFLAPIEI